MLRDDESIVYDQTLDYGAAYSPGGTRPFYRNNVKYRDGTSEAITIDGGFRRTDVVFRDCMRDTFRIADWQNRRYGPCRSYFPFFGGPNSNSGIHAAVRWCEQQTGILIRRTRFHNETMSPGWWNYNLGFYDQDEAHICP